MSNIFNNINNSNNIFNDPAAGVSQTEYNFLENKVNTNTSAISSVLANDSIQSNNLSSLNSSVSSLNTSVTNINSNISTINNKINSTSVKIGQNSISTSNNTISIGNLSRSNAQDSIAIGYQTEVNGDGSICIGRYAKTSLSSSIVINALSFGGGLDPSTNGVFIQPVMDDISTNNNIMCYNDITKEVTQNSSLYPNINNSITTLKNSFDKSKAYAFCQYNSQTQTKNNSLNISSITYVGTGVFKANFTTGIFSNTDYTALVSCNKAGLGDDANMIVSLGCEDSDRQYSVDYVPISVSYANYVYVHCNPTRVNLCVFYNNPNL